MLGRAFAHDIRAAGVAYATPAAAGGASTARCYVLVTPDGERTMNTYLGAAQALGPPDIDADMIAASAVIYLEGYLWDPKDAKDAFVKAAEIAHRGRAHGCADALRCLLRRSLARGVPASDALTHRGSDLRQRGRAAQSLSDRRLQHGGRGLARRHRYARW